jgi:hypothetical protein
MTTTRPHRSRFRSLARDRYIVSPGFDWLFFIGSPLLAVAAIFAALRFVPAERVEVVVLSYLAVGHHVPTFLRAYSDPDELAEHRWRLTVVPIAVVYVMVLLFAFESRLLSLVFIWDQYHFVRQHYGFMRLYDAKNGNLAADVGRFDQPLCFALFLAIIAHSDFYAFLYTEGLYELGVLLPMWLGPVLREATLWGAGGVATFWLADLARQAARGQPIALPKLAILASTYAVWAWSYSVLSAPLLSYSISACFHCVQYDALAWWYNHRKADTLGERPGSAVFRYLHTRNHIWLYAACIFAYGFLSRWGGESLPALVFFVNRTTGLLHYYFDSFIWRVRKAEFRRHLA